MNPAAHQVVHDVIAAGNRIKNSTHEPCLIATLDSAKAKIYAILILLVRGEILAGCGVVVRSVRGWFFHD